MCTERKDPEARIIELRVLSCSDFIAAEARYHTACRDRFNLKVKDNIVSPGTKGRPVKDPRAFESLCEWLETKGELHTLEDLRNKLQEITGAEDVYSTKTIQRKLKEKYGEDIFINEVNGRANVICFSIVASRLINDMWYENRKKDPDQDAERIIKTAAKFIVAEIRNKSFDCEYYPDTKSISHEKKNLEWLTPKLKLFMEICVRSPIQQASIGQCITHAIRPRSTIPPILFGTAVEMEHVFRSRWNVDQLAKLGYSLSYDEVKRYKQSVLDNESAHDWLQRNMEGSFYHWIADNVDHNVRTLDGKGTLHAMGIIVTTTGPTVSYQNMPLIPRQKLKKVDELVRNKGIPIKSYVQPNVSGLSKVYLSAYEGLKSTYTPPKNTMIDLLWHSAYFFKKKRPGWSGFMSDVSVGEHDGKADCTMLPIIDLDPNDYSCIYSTLLFIIDQARHLDITAPCVTFDQPLWLKAMEIVKAESFNVVLILGGFHTMMSFTGSIGALMDGSGLSECLGTIFGANTVPKIMEAKAISRAIRGHFLIETSLMAKLLGSFIPVSTENDGTDLGEDETDLGEDETDHGEDETDLGIDDDGENLSMSGEECDEDAFDISDTDVTSAFEGAGLRKLSDEEKCELKHIYQVMQENYEEGLEQLHTSSAFKIVSTSLEKLKDQLRAQSRTAKLWLNYMDYIDVLKQFIRAERCGDWDLHLYALEKMLNLFAATGHLNYAKCARLHLQEMRNLETTHPWIYRCFKEKGYHTVRRSDRYWAGLWTDLIIEQVMMRSLKTRGGITRGGGISESVRLVWVGSMHRRAGIHEAMTTLTKLKRTTSEQHVELTASRRERDMNAMSKVLLWFDSHNPFDTRVEALRSLSTGLTASDEDKINCDDAENIGYQIQAKVDGICFEQVTMKRKEQVRSLACLKEGIKVDNEKVHIDPLVLFGRLTTLAQRQNDIKEQIHYEFTTEPTSLFKNGLMRKPTKSSLRTHVTKNALQSKTPSEHVVIDGGALLYNVKWLRNSSYDDLTSQYMNHLQRKCGHCVIHVVFDGYDDPLSTKAHEHFRRTTVSAADVNITDTSMQVTSTRKAFLRNTHNKKELIRILRQKFSEIGIETCQSTVDADVLTVKKALELSENHDMTVVSDDTDILVLLMYHWRSTSMKDIVFATTKSVNKKKVPVNYSIKDLVSKQPLTAHLLFAHAWTGCDTTSAIQNQGKVKILQLLKSTSIQDCVSCFGDIFATPEVVGASGIELFIKSYGGKSRDTLNVLRYAKFVQMLATSSVVEPSELPPTERAAYYHALRVHLQVAQWMNLDLGCLDPTKWGWKIEQGCLVPIKTDIEPAPEFLLNFIRCNCKTSTRNPCGTTHCSCRKHGLKCVAACGDCRGEQCNNMVTEEHIVDDDEELERNVFDLFQ